LTLQKNIIGYVVIYGIDNIAKLSDIVVATIVLPNGMILPSKRFSVNDIPGADVLIGMDIISMGDFCISNARGRTLFSFVIPSYKDKISYSNMVSS